MIFWAIVAFLAVCVGYLPRNKKLEYWPFDKYGEYKK